MMMLMLMLTMLTWHETIKEMTVIEMIGQKKEMGARKEI
jgi:hypothetical protein